METSHVLDGDVKNLPDTKVFVDAIGATYGQIGSVIEQSQANMQQLGVAGAPIELASVLHGLCGMAVAAAQVRAQYVAQQIAFIDDHITSDDTLAGTQAGGGLDNT